MQTFSFKTLLLLTYNFQKFQIWSFRIFVCMIFDTSLRDTVQTSKTIFIGNLLMFHPLGLFQDYMYKKICIAKKSATKTKNIPLFSTPQPPF